MGNLQTAAVYSMTSGTAGQPIYERTYLYDDNGFLTGYDDLDGGCSYSLDEMGTPIEMMTQAGSCTLEWGEGRMLTGIELDPDNKAAYTYNDSGLRVKKTVTESGVVTDWEYVWGDNGLAAVRQGEDVAVVLYDSEGEATGFSLNGAIYTYLKNLQGDVLRVFDETGTAVVSYQYDPWGVPTATGDGELAKMNPCTYRGYYYDQETGYYYLQSRYYNPDTGRFLNADTIWMLGQSQDSFVQYNLFSYCQNQIIVSSDPTGYARIYIVLKVSFLRDVVTAGCSAIAAIICTVIFGGNAFAGIVGAALGWIIGGSLSRTLIKRDIRFSVWIPWVKSRTWTIW